MFTRSTTGEKRITVQYVLTGSPLGADVPTLARVTIDSTIPHKMSLRSNYLWQLKTAIAVHRWFQNGGKRMLLSSL